MKINLLKKTAFLLIIINSITACVSFQPDSHPVAPLRVEFTQRWGDYTLVLAQEQGLFKKHGVDVEIVYYDVFSNTFPDLASGQIDGALIAIGDVININRSAELKVVATSDDGGASAILAREEINSIEDLKGQTVGVLIGSQYELLVAEMLKSANMDTGSVTLVAVNPEDAVFALKNNQVKAVYTWEPFLSEAVSSGNKQIYPTNSRSHFPNMVVFRKSVVEQRPEDIRAFLRAWFEAVNYRLENPEQTRSIAANYLSMGIEEVQPDNNLKIFTLDDNKAFYNIQEQNSIFSVTKTASDYLISIGAIAQIVDPLELLDPSFMP